MIAVDYRPLDAVHLSDVDESSQGTAVLLQFIVGEFTKPEVFPPSRLLLSAVPFQQLREEPTRPMFVVPSCFIGWKSRK